MKRSHPVPMVAFVLGAEDLHPCAFPSRHWSLFLLAAGPSARIDPWHCESAARA
jgi:hypothetical protein